MICTALLAGCGGGGNSGEASLAAKYAGKWSSPCIAVNGRQSLRQEWQVKEEYGVDLGGVKVATLYGNTSCSGNPKSQLWYYIGGNKAASRQTGAGQADMIMVSFTNPNGGADPAAEPHLWLLKDGVLYMGSTGKAADGYPADVDLSLAFSRQ